MLHLVTGAAGFIGSHVCERLLRRGDSVVGIDNFDAFYSREAKQRNLAEASRESRFRLIELDLRDEAGLRELLNSHRFDNVLHIAAKAGVRPSILAPGEYLDVNVRGTLNLLAACRDRGVGHFVFASSSSVYGNAARPPFREEDITDRPESPYGATKKAAEVLCHAFQRLLDLPVTCLRFFTVYGPRQRPDLAIHKFTRLIDQGEPIPFFGDGTTSRDYTFVDDTVDGVIGALDRPPSGGYRILNLGRNDPVTLSEMVAAIEAALGKTATRRQLPEQVGDVRMTCADVSRAAEVLGYRPKVGFQEGISRFVEWYRREDGRRAR